LTALKAKQFVSLTAKFQNSSTKRDTVNPRISRLIGREERSPDKAIIRISEAKGSPKGENLRQK
jgi:hypothetical protein